MVKRTGWREGDAEVADKEPSLIDIMIMLWNDRADEVVSMYPRCERAASVGPAMLKAPMLLLYVLRESLVLALIRTPLTLFFSVVVLIVTGIGFFWPFAVMAALIYGGHQYLTHDNTTLDTRGVPAVQQPAEMPGE